MEAPTQEDKGHSGLGIASFIISILAFFVVILFFAIDASETTAGAGICGAAFANLVGIGLGIAGVAQGDRKKVFAILGLVFNVLAILGVVGLMLIGIAVVGF